MTTFGTIPASRVGGIITVVMTLIGWSSIPLFLRHFADHIDVWTSNGWRYGFSALLWAPLVIVVTARGRMPAGTWRRALVPSIINACGQVCFTSAHYFIDPGLLTFGLRTQLLFVAIGAYLLFPTERAIIRSRSYRIGLLLVLLGTMMTILLDPNPPTFDHTLGVVLAIASGLLFASYGLSVRRCMEGISPILSFAVICQWTAVIIVGLMFIFAERFGATAFDMGTFEFTMLLGSAVIGIALGHTFYYLSIARLGVAVSSGVLQLQPFLVAIASLWLFGEALTALQWTGGFIAVAGAAVMLRTRGPQIPRARGPA